jgi:hypothetical protein
MIASVPFPVSVTIFVHFLFFILLFSEADEILKICNVIGSPDEQAWPEGLSLAGAMKYQFPQVNIYLFFVFAVILLVRNSCVSSITKYLLFEEYFCVNYFLSSLSFLHLPFYLDGHMFCSCTSCFL